jgi:hypothetical protein
MLMIKLRMNRVTIVRHICRLQEPNRDALVLYARFIGDTGVLRHQSTDRHHDRGMTPTTASIRGRTVVPMSSIR